VVRRRSPLPPSWLAVVEGATAAFTGTARVLGDTPAATSLRGPGHEVTAEVTPGDAVFGPPPAAALTLKGETALPPERRVTSRFPPDSLRELPYWDQAQPGTATPVLCLLSTPPALRALTGPGDDLPHAVATIRGWTAATGDVERDLAKPSPAVCYVAGFELLLRTTPDVPALASRFLRLPGRPGAAARGILQLLQQRTVLLADTEVADLARRLLPGLAAETDPEAAVAYLAFFSATRDRLTATDPALAAAVRTEAGRAAERPYDGGPWQQEVIRYARAVTV
jgi:hypothetical protein